MIDAPLGYAFTLGMVAAFNPCGFPMLPAYLSYFIGVDDTSADAGGRVVRALGAAAAVSIGFLGVFLVLGIPINASVHWIYRVMPWLTIVVGVGLAGLGVAMVAGRPLKLGLPRLDKGGSSRRFGSMVLFGVSFAITSLSCTIGIFLSVITGVASRANLASGALTVVAYGVGMSLVFMVLSIAIALARESMVRRMRAVLRHIDRVAGALMVGVGAYLVYYGIWSTDSLNDAGVSPFGPVQRWTSQVQVRVTNGGEGLGILLAALVVAAVVVAVVARRRQGSGGVAASPVEPEVGPSAEPEVGAPSR